MNLEYYNTPAPESLQVQLLPKELPAFLSYRPDFALLEELQKEYAQYKKIVVIGHGGSITSFLGMYTSLCAHSGVEVFFLNTVDADYIASVRSATTPQDTLVLAVSKSGETITLFEVLSQFADYPLVCLTEAGSPLAQAAEKLGARVVAHPAIGGRFTGVTEVGLLPAVLCGVDVATVFAGAAELYKQFQKDNLAWKAASILWQLEQKGFVDVFLPVYSRGLYGLAQLFVQLCHESYGKEGRGQTFLASEAPESQHHTNQRFFGGRKNMCGFFVTTEATSESIVRYPASLHSIPVHGRHLADMNGLSLKQAMQAEWQGTLDDARLKNMPVLHLSTAVVDARNVGRQIAFWQLVAVYGALLRGVDPFSQPQVESSKLLSVTKRLSLLGLA